MTQHHPQRTLLIIKPDAVRRGLVGEILHRIEVDGFQIVSLRMQRLSERQARGFYAVHRAKPFYEPLCKFMTSGRCVLCVLEREGAIESLRQLVGKTNPREAAFGTIRHDYATDTRQNCVHASDSPQSAAREIGFFFRPSGLERVRRGLKKIYRLPFVKR
ncbi:MAG: nucleoside-diphosphate kinase [Candidatus Edwardsbacteria bacterium]|nr:nucleoside-diphosphate kinase [Candidatus Edwardsbacteria bacterium]